MSNVTELRSGNHSDQDEWQSRVDLAAVFRLAEMADWHEAVANHFSLAVSGDGKKFLMNPRWRHFSKITATELLLLDADDETTMHSANAPDPTAWCIHGRMHKALAHARCILHVHPTYATALCGLADPEIKPIDQITAKFFNRVAYDMGFTGMANTEQEGDRLASTLGNKKIMMMANHGVTVLGNSVAEAFDDLYLLERACRTLMLAYSSGQKLNIMSDAVAEKTACEWEEFATYGAPQAHFDEMKKILDDKDPSYAT